MIKGFFTDEEIEYGTRKKVDLDSIGPNCRECGLYKTVKSPRMKWSGKGEKNCLVIGEAPGGNEDLKGTQFEKHAQAGGLLRKEIGGRRLELDQDFWKTNSVCCRPTKKGGASNRAPTDAELRFCKPFLEQTIKDLSPGFIWLLGGKAVESFYMGVFKRKAITRFRGLCIPDQKYQAWIIPQFHPSFIIRDIQNKNLTSQYSRDMKFAVDCLSKPPVKPRSYNDHITPITNYDELIQVLDNILALKPEKLEVDFETTGLKPFKHGHKIVSISMCTDKSHAISFPYQYRDFWDRKQFVRIKQKVRKILVHEEIFKMAHNIKFEQVWAHELLGIDIEPWSWCSQTAAHILDNRRGFSGLKFQAYVNFGVYPYGAQVDRYIRGFPFNKMEECPLEDLLHYGGLDSLFGFMLEDAQFKQFEERGQKLLDAYEFFHDGTLAMGRLEINGICTDDEYYETQSNKQGTGEIDRKIIEGLKVTKFGEDAKLFKEREGREIDIESPKDLGILLYDVLKYPPVLTDKGNRSVDEKALKKINSLFCQNLLKLRKLIKLRSTYMAQFKRFSFNGKIHPSFGLNIPVTFRSQSDTPNLQNIPKHDKFSKKACRRGIIPRIGGGLLSSDFSGIEVGISACYNKDKNLIKYVTDEGTDMHRDTAMDIWMLPKSEITQDIRFSGKSGWVFPQFYNSYYVNCAIDLWDTYLDLETMSGETLKKHMAKKGIRDLDSFTAHCKKVEGKFWGERFRTYKLWKDQINKEYQRKGYLETYFGFQFTGYMSRNECCNYQTQGTAFHCLLWTLLEVEREIKRKRMRSLLVGQIHDDMMTDYVENELKEIIEIIDYFGTERIREVHPWIIIPLKIDHEISGIDGNWAEMDEIK